MGLQGVSPCERLLLEKKRKPFDIDATAVKRFRKKKIILLNLNNTPVRFSRDLLFPIDENRFRVFYPLTENL
jgi:hypothetical protein